jgi:hypothetical protein
VTGVQGEWWNWRGTGRLAQPQSVIVFHLPTSPVAVQFEHVKEISTLTNRHPEGRFCERALSSAREQA